MAFMTDWSDPYSPPPRPRRPGMTMASLAPGDSGLGVDPMPTPNGGFWYRDALPETSFNPQIMSGGITGLGLSGQPEPNSAISPPGAAAGELLAQARPKLPPPGSMEGAVSPSQPSPLSASADVPPGPSPVTSGPPPVPVKSAPPPGFPDLPRPEAPMPSPTPVESVPGASPLVGEMTAAARNKMSRVQELDKQLAGGPKNNWAQRLALAALSVTKLAPIANQIVHPKYSQQVAERGQAMEDVRNLTQTAYQAEARDAVADQRRAQADNYAQQQDLARRRQESEESTKRATLLQKEEDGLLKGRRHYVLGPEESPPPGWDLINSVTMPGTRYAASPRFAPITKELLPFAAGRKEGDMVSTEEFEKLQGLAGQAAVQAQKPAGWAYQKSEDRDGTVREWWVNPATQESTEPVVKGRIGKPQQPTMAMLQNSDENQDMYERVAQSLARGDLSRLRDIASLRGDQRLRLYDRATQINPQFSTADIDRQIKTEDYWANGQGANQLQSFGTFLEHAGEALSVMQHLQQTNTAVLNRSYNWLRARGSSPEYRAALAAIEPVKKEFESFLLNNRALYAEDRASADKMLNPDLPLSDFLSAIQQMGHTVQARYNEGAQRYQNTRHKSLQESFPLSPGAIASAQKLGLNLGGSTAPPPGGGSQPRVQKHPSTGEYRHSLDGGQTWLPGLPRK
jgi:hypothetical protein